MAAAHVQTQRATGTDGNSSVGISMTVTAGNSLLVFVQGGSGQTVSGVSGGGNSYNAQTGVTGPFYGIKVTSFTAHGISGGTYTVTGTFSGATYYPWIMVVEVSGADSDGPSGYVYDASPSPTGTDGVATTGGANSSQGLMFGLAFGVSSSSPGTGFSFDNYGSDMGSAGVGYTTYWVTEYMHISSTGSSVNAIWTNTYSSDNIGAIAQMVYDSGTPSSVHFHTTLSGIGTKAGQRQVQF